jgi:hypothetical protein
MTGPRLQTTIEKAFEERTKITAATQSDVRDAVETALDPRPGRICGRSTSG